MDFTFNEDQQAAVYGRRPDDEQALVFRQGLEGLGRHGNGFGQFLCLGQRAANGQHIHPRQWPHHQQSEQHRRQK